MQEHTLMIPLGHPNRPGTKLEKLNGIVIHYTANYNPGADDIANARYFGRKWEASATGQPLEAYRDKNGNPIPFRYGSAHVIIDENSVTNCIPFDEVGWHVGDRPLAWTPEFKGQRPMAKVVFGNRQNYQTIGVEIACNGNWDKAVQNTIEWLRKFCQERALKPAAGTQVRNNEVIICRHYDLTGKLCPKPFIDDPKAWERFLSEVCK